MNDITLPLATAVVIVIALLGAFAFRVRVTAGNFEKSVKEKFTQAEASRTADQTALRSAIDKVNEQVGRIEWELPREYVRRADHVEAMATVTAKIDAVQQQGAHLLSLVSRIEGKVNRD